MEGFKTYTLGLSLEVPTSNEKPVALISHDQFIPLFPWSSEFRGCTLGSPEELVSRCNARARSGQGKSQFLGGGSQASELGLMGSQL